MYRAVIFDFFGVIHSDPASRWFAKNNIERTGRYEDVFKQVDYGQITMSEAFHALSALSKRPVSELKHVFGQTNMIDEEVISLIHKLKHNYSIGLLSNATGNYLRGILAEQSISQLFDQVVISSDVGTIKPDPVIYVKMLEVLGCTAEEAVFIDDGIHNVHASQKLGMLGIDFTNAANLLQELKKNNIL
jgi:HAD superfamily hydrolase (TIGR01509 family)